MRGRRRYEVCSKGEVEEYLKYLERRFGIPRERFSGFHFLKRGRDVWVFSGDVAAREAVAGVEVVGVRALKMSAKRVVKPTTTFLQIFGKYATKNVVKLESEEELTTFMAGGIVERKFDVEKGYVVVRYGEDVLGCGLYDGGCLISQIPKAKRVDERWLFREG